MILGVKSEQNIYVYDQFREANSQKADTVGKIFFNFLKMQVPCFILDCFHHMESLFCSVWKRCSSLQSVQSSLATGEPKRELREHPKEKDAT